MNRSGKPILALDLPSGLDADTGQPLGVAVRARATATFVAPKLGFAAPGAADYTGEVAVIDIGVPGRSSVLSSDVPLERLDEIPGQTARRRHHVRFRKATEVGRDGGSFRAGAVTFDRSDGLRRRGILHRGEAQTCAIPASASLTRS